LQDAPEGRLSAAFFVPGNASASLLAGLAGLAFVLVALDHVFPAVPALHREAETGATDGDVGPTVDALRLQELGDADVAGDPAPAAVGLPAQQLEAGAGEAVAERPALAHHGLGAAIAVEVAHFVDAG